MHSSAKPRGAVAWALYDLANTIYSMNVVTLFFSQWVTDDRGRQDIWFNGFYSASMLLVALTLPYLGLWSDRGGHRLRFLAVFTAVSVAATAALGGLTRLDGTTGLVLALLAFALSNYAFQGSLVFYNALLPAVSTPGTQGRVSGFGVGLGYVGSVIGMMLVTPFVEGTVPILGWSPGFVEAGGRSAAFLPTALLFALFALPIFFLVREPKSASGPRPSFREAVASLKAALVDTARYPGVRLFLLVNLLILDGVHTAIVNMVTYAREVVGIPTDTAKVNFFILATGFAIVGSFVAGRLSDRLGPKRIFVATAWLWMACPLVIATTSSITVFYLTGGLVGIILGSLWTVTRPLLLSMTPPGEEGRLFGLYSFCNKSAAVIGPLLWGVITLAGTSLGPMRYRIAVAFLALVAGVGAYLAGRLPDRAPRG